MSSTVLPHTAGSQGVAKPKKNIFGVAANAGVTNANARKGVYADASTQDGLINDVHRVAVGSWYNGPAELRSILESYAQAVAGEHSYATSTGGVLGANFGFISHLARRLPAPILFDDPKISEFIFGNNKPTAAVDTSGRMWVSASFLEECLQEESRDRMMIMPLMLHEYLHIALNHTRRMHNFPPDVSNIAKDKVINPMAAKMFPPNAFHSFSDIFKLAHGNNPEDKRFEGMSEETIAKLMMNERRQALENLGTIRIKNLIIEDGPVTSINKLKAGKGEIKEYDTVYVKVQDMGMMDRVDTEFECATLEIDNIDNRLKVRKRPGANGQAQQQQPSPIEIPTQSDTPSQGQGQGEPQDGSGDDSDPGRKNLEDIKRDMGAQGQGKDAQGQDKDAQGQGKDAQGQGKDAQGQGKDTQGQGKDAQGQGKDAQGQGNDAQGQGKDAQGAVKGDEQPQTDAAGQPGQGKPGQGNQDKSADGAANGSGADAGLSAKDSGPSDGRAPKADPRMGTKDDGGGQADGVSGKGFKGKPQDALKGLVNDNPLNSENGHEIDLDKLNEWLKKNGHEELVRKMRADDFEEGAIDRVIEVSLKEAEKERLIIGSGYAGGHVEEYMHTVVRPNSLYKVNWMRAAIEFLQGSGSSVTSTLDEYGIYTYIDPQDIGFSADDGIYYSGSVQQKPDGAYFVVLDTSGSIWCDQRRMAHLVAFALGIKGTQDELSPDVWIVGADTVVSGKPQFYDDDQIQEAIDTGVPLGGGGGTDYTTPINQVMAWCKESDVKPLGILYLGDFEVSPPKREELPEDLPPVFFLGMPHDVVRADSFIKSVSSWADVYTIEDDLTIDAIAAQAKADSTKHLGHKTP